MPITEGGRFSPTQNIISPGVFTRENDLSGIAQGVADIGGAIVSPFPKGPAFTPTLVRSVTELEEKFGVADGVYYGPYTAKEYLTERGLVTVCRVGALTGYKQNYPFVIWAISGSYNRGVGVGSLDPNSSYMDPVNSGADYAGEIVYSPQISSSNTTTASGISITSVANSDTAGFNGSAGANYYKISMVDYFGNEGSASTAVQAAAPTHSYFDVTWGAINYAQGYNVYRATPASPSVYKKVNSSLVTTNRFRDVKTYVGTTPPPTPASTYAYDISVNSGSFYFNVPVVFTFQADAENADIPTGLGSTSGSITYAGQTVLLNLVARVTSSATLKTNISSSIQGLISYTPAQKLAYAIASGSFSGSFNTTLGWAADVPTMVDSTGNYPSFAGARLVSGSWYLTSTACSANTIAVAGLLSGSFGTYNGTFTPAGTSTFNICTNEWSSSTTADNRVLAVLADTQNATITDLVAPGFSGSTITTASVGTTIGNDFVLTLKPSTGTSIYGNYNFSLDPASSEYITNVFGSDATAGAPPVATGQKIEAAYLYKVFENQISKIVSEPGKWWVSGSHLPIADSQLWTGNPLDFTDDYSRNLTNGDSTFSITHATTPWILSQAVAAWAGASGVSSTTRFRLFKAHTLSDGTNTNTSYKIEISNVKLAGQVAGSDWGSFTLTVRKFSDTDKRPVILETFQNLNLDENSSNFIARRIGDRYNYINFAGKIIEFGTYTNLSKYIRIEMATTPWATSAVPAGFEALITPINSSMGNWAVPVRYTRASIYGVDPGKYPSGIAFGDAPTGADAELSALYPVSSTGNGVADDNLQYFAPIPSFGAYSSTGRNTIFALDQTTTDWGFDKPESTGSYLDASLNGAVPYIFESTVTEPSYVKMRKFVVGFQGGFDGQSPAIPINVGSDIIPGNTQGLDCTTISSAGSIAYKQCIGALGNADEFDINLIATPGIVHQHHPYVTNLVIDMCETRGDCFYIMDLHVTPETEGSVGQIDEVVYYAQQYDTNYAAAYYPWIKILDTNTNKIIRVPPSVVLPAIYAANDKVSAEWFAPAGLNRGGITQAVQVCDRTTHEERDTLYEGKVNPIAAFPGQGICVWGQKTLQNAASATDRVNVRRLLIGIKKFIASTSKYLVFEQNVASTRNKFLAIVNPYLESIQQRSGLYAFQVVMDETNNTPDLIDRNILYGQLYLKPAKTAEFIILDFNILPTGAQFPGA